MTTERTRPEAVLVGCRVAEARAAAGLTQVEVARRVGCQRSFVARVEAGGAVPRLVALWTWAKALEVTRAQLVGDEPIT